MTVLTPKADLAIAEIAFFSPALIVSAFVVFRHGFSRQLGWIYLVLLSLLRIIGASCILYMVTQNKYTQGLSETAEITSSIGTAPLLLAIIGFMGRVNESLVPEGRISFIFFRGFQLMALAALIIAIVGGIDANDNPASSSFHTGHELREAASILFLVLYLCEVVLVSLLFRHRNEVATGENRLVLSALLALPFICVRVIYTVLLAFTTDRSSVFYFENVNVYVEAFMQFCMEAIVVLIFTVTGLVTPKRQEYSQDMSVRDTQVPMHGRPVERPVDHPISQPQQPQKNLGDYRPSRMIRNALRGQ